MGFDSISDASVPAFSKDLSKKKRTNRSAKLKQSKLDLRREQWLSKVKNKERKSDGRGKSPPSSMQVRDEHSRSLENLEIMPSGEENEGSSSHYTDSESVMSSPTGSSLGNNDSGKVLPRSSSISSGCCSGSVSEEEGDDGCLDDWEAVADALTVDDNQHNTISEPPSEPKTRVRSADPELPEDNSGVDFSKMGSKGMVPRSQVPCQAWRADDAFRPRCLPNLSKQHCFPSNLERHCDRGVITWSWQSIVSQPSSCPICYEDLDLTDSSFLPCSCGFRLCLFCHKKILEADGRCPGCRKQYDPIDGNIGFSGGVALVRMSRSSSMGTSS